jgi:hypothetical protein
MKSQTLYQQLVAANLGKDVEKIINSVDELYNAHDIIRKNSEGKWVCPVCGKSYVHASRVEKHFEDRSCFSPRDIFKHTEVEREAFSLAAEIKERGFFSMSVFRKSNYYVLLNQFILTCWIHNIHSPLLLFAYISEVKVGRKYSSNTAYIAKKLLNDPMDCVQDFRQWIQCQPVDNMELEKENIEKLKARKGDESFVPTLLWKIRYAHISFKGASCAGLFDYLDTWNAAHHMTLRSIEEELGVY